MEKKTDAATQFADEVNAGFRKAEVERSLIEFSRYKQDCRKKALDWAMEKCFSVGEKYMMEQADKYYNWLINLPQ